jgi:hypothetical protein
MTIGEQNNKSNIVMQNKYTISFIENWKTEYMLPNETKQIINFLNDTLQIVEDTTISSSHISKQKYIDSKNGNNDNEKFITKNYGNMLN